MLVGILVCVVLGVVIALVLGCVFGGSKRESYLPSPPVGNERRYW